MSSVPLSSSLARLFSGVTKVEFRREMAMVLRHLGKKYPTFVDPCAGGLEVVDAAIQAGYSPENVLAGDINPFTHALAGFVTGIPFKDLGVKIEHEFWDVIRSRTSSESYPEFLLAIKCLQLREHLAYEKQYLDDFLARAPYYAGKLRERLFARLKALKASPLIRCEGIKTTCLSRYRKVKLNNGILDVTFRERTPDSDMYRIVYEAKFRPDNYAACIRRYLGECQTRPEPSES